MTSTYHNVTIKGVPVGVPNVVNHATGYYVSYNNYDRGTYGCDTTAIVIDKTSAFLILNGDHRGPLNGLSLNDACQYFHDRPELKNSLSDDHQDDVLREVDGKWVMVRI